VLTLSCTKVVLAASRAARFAAAAALSGMMLTAISTAAHADGIAVGGCVGPWRSVNCVARWGDAGDPYSRTVVGPSNQTERALAAERDHKWQERCKPVIVQDYYGVPRYRYLAPGCEFGITE
jgi:hypothetical protein